MKKFVITQSVNKDHTDPSILCVLQVKSKYPGISFMEFCTVQEFWTTTKDTFRLPVSFHLFVRDNVINSLVPLITVLPSQLFDGICQYHQFWFSTSRYIWL